MNYLNNIIAQNIRSRLFPSGKLKIQLKLIKNILKKYPDSEYAKSLYRNLKLKFWLGSKRITYEQLIEEAWTKLLLNSSSDTISLTGFHFKNDPLLKMELTDIFISDPTFDYSFFSKDEWIAVKFLSTCYSEGPYQNESVFLKQDDIVIDAGANMGIFSLFASTKNVEKIYAFEPQRKVIDILQYNIKLNDKSNIIEVIPKGLSDMSGSFVLHHVDEFHGSASIVLEQSNATNFETINCVTLDEWVIENEITRIDFIKADIEGAERKLLSGASQILKLFAPRLAICTYHFPDDPKILSNIIMTANPNYIIKQSAFKLYAYVP